MIKKSDKPNKDLPKWDSNSGRKIHGKKEMEDKKKLESVGALQ